MSNRDFECPACSRYGYDSGFKCLHCGYQEGEGVTLEVGAKLDSLQGPYLRKREADLKALGAYPMAPKHEPVEIRLEVPKLAPGSFSPPTDFMAELERERKEDKPADVRPSLPRFTAADMRSSYGMRSKVQKPPATLKKEEFMERCSAELLSSSALRRVHAVLSADLDTYWVSNTWGDITRCEELEAQIAAYLNSLPAEYRRRPKGTDRAFVARVLIRYSRTGKSG